MSRILYKAQFAARLLGTLLIIFCLTSSKLSAQNSCPVNIDFETGTFTNWQCYRGTTKDISNANVITVSPTAPTFNVHTIIPRSNAIDPYGKFPIAAPDGSNYSVRLGNDGTGAQAERLTYNFNVPTGQANFSITYQYAVVFQDGGHPAAQQPRFTAKVLDVAANTYITCSSFDYVATSKLPGFQQSKLSSIVYYKTWTPVTINLTGYQGRQIQLEFTTADCTQGGHFGYAYVDVNQNCSSLVSGADYCDKPTSIALNGPAGFAQYTWYNADRSQVLGTTNPLILNPTLPDGTVVMVDVVPFVGFGCPSTVVTTIQSHVLGLTVTNPSPVCAPTVVDITQPPVVSYLDQTATVTYWSDAATTLPVADPTKVAVSGTYYIKATNSAGCLQILPISVVVNPFADLRVTDPTPICATTTVDITQPAVTAGSVSGLTYTYWHNEAATIPLANAQALTTSGTYYIKGANSSGCQNIKPVNVTIFPLPVLNVTSPAPVCSPVTIDITQASVTTGSDAGLTLSYWQDTSATVPLANPSAITKTAVYYIKATNTNGCQQIKPINVVINPLPVLVVTNPDQVCKPDKIDLTAPAVTAGSSGVDKYTYWMDANASIPLKNYTAVTDSGTYYIKATSIFGCEVVSPVYLNIHNLPVIKITTPYRVYQPGKIDLTSKAIIKGSSPNLAYSYYMDATLSTPVTNPTAIGVTGTYYIKGENQYGCYSVMPVNLYLPFKPDIVVPKAFTPAQNINNRLYPFLVGIKTFKSFVVYNRWGNQVFATTDASPDKGWDGTYKGGVLFFETFSWVADGFDDAGNVVHRAGSTMILK